MAEHKQRSVKIGLEKVLEGQSSTLKGLRLGLICNQASVDRKFRHAADLFYSHPEMNLQALFGPQHGIRGDVQDNMVETGHAIDKITGLPIHSLYSDTREPTLEMLSEVDALVFDLQDVGCRVYTFIYTLANAMKACAEYDKKMFVLDRPNPLGGVCIEGNVLEKGNESFVGMYPIPMRHGLTVGEIARLFNKEYEINCELEVVSMDGWERADFQDETDAPWVMPSPNMPTVDTAIVFPGTVFFEGTQVSEGRGTTRPFEIVGAPYISSVGFADALNSLELSGVTFRGVEFLPTFQKHKGVLCGGVFVHITDRRVFEPVITGVAMIKTAFDLYPNEFKWKDAPYEYVYDRNPFDVIAGTTKLRARLEQGIELKNIVAEWKTNLENFRLLRQQYLLY